MTCWIPCSNEVQLLFGALGAQGFRGSRGLGALGVLGLRLYQSFVCLSCCFSIIFMFRLFSCSRPESRTSNTVDSHEP